ncbi:hypothetical protein [Halosegnis longus]|uniref:Uncharacterized protein n=1 Tax=Halosegnis longus TaxID=2216012 RepID=A0AAJ4R9H5_9EURY|nr:hypothetical protein Nmn1133_10755 [Salella cibi]
MPLSRRAFLASAGVVTGGSTLADRVAPATGILAEALGSHAESETESTGQEDDGPVRTFNDEFRLMRDDRQTYDFEFDTPVQIRYDAIIRWGNAQPGIDFLFFQSDEEFDAYLAGERARYTNPGSLFGVASVNDYVFRAEPGRYHLAVDNSDWVGGFGEPLNGNPRDINETPNVPRGSASDGSDILGIDFEFEATEIQPPSETDGSSTSTDTGSQT